MGSGVASGARPGQGKGEIVEFKNYRATVTQPYGMGEHVSLFPTAEAADIYTVGMEPWPVKVDVQRFDLDAGDVITVRSVGDSREFTGTVGKFREMANGTRQVFVDTGYPDQSWFYPWQIVAKHDPAEMRAHRWGPVIDESGIRTCTRLGCYKQWMRRNPEELGCKGTE